MDRKINRRSFLRNAAAGGAALVILRNSASVWGYQANEGVGVALVGVNGRGAWFAGLLERKAYGMRPAALCDVDAKRSAQTYGKFPDVPKYDDYRVMLDKQKDIDAVIVPTPEFSRAIILAAAMKAGKHVFGEKPLTRLPQEARFLRELAIKSKLATQMGNQGTSGMGFQRAQAMVQAGLLGDITEVHVWNGASEPQGDEPPMDSREQSVPTGSQPVPEGLSWDLWLNGAASRGYHEMWYTRWKSYRDFGSSNAGWGATHSGALPFMATRIYELWDAVETPVEQRCIRIEPRVPSISKIGFPRWEYIRCEIPARGKLPPLTWNYHRIAMHFAEKALGEHPEWRQKRPKPWWGGGQGGSAIVGTKGKLDATHYGSSWNVYPGELAASELLQQVADVGGHDRSWVEACRGRGTTASNFSISGPLTELLMLGNVATLIGEPFVYDPVTGNVLDNEKVAAALSPQYRDGWSL